LSGREKLWLNQRRPGLCINALFVLLTYLYISNTNLNRDNTIAFIFFCTVLTLLEMVQPSTDIFMAAGGVVSRDTTFQRPKFKTLQQEPCYLVTRKKVPTSCGIANPDL